MVFKKQILSKAGLFLLLALFHASLIANDDAVMDSLWNLTLEELLQVKVTSVASNQASSIREQPAVVSIISAKDIQQAGARDLIDVLRLIPGFDFQYDVFSVIGISFRGIWSFEGRILLMIDGIEYTDMLYGTLPFGQHFAVNQIKKIEIIRGPGAAKYGGNAQLAVIKITTKGKDINGVETIVSSGVMGSSNAFNSVTVNAGQRLEQGFIKASLAASTSPHSAQNYIDFYGKKFDQEKNSKRNTQNLNLGGEYQDLKFQLIIDRFQQEQQDLYGFVIGTQEVNFDGDMARLEYPWKISPEFTLVSSIDYQRQDNWHSRSLVDLTATFGVSDLPFQMKTKLDSYQLQGHFRPGTSLSVDTGIIYQQERAHAKEIFKALSGIDAATAFNGSSKANYHTQAAFFQADWVNDYGNWSLGGRYSKHSLVGESWVPRISYVKHWQKWHVKSVYSHSFREPEFAITVVNSTLLPETAKTGEVEVGYQISANKSLSLNIFHTIIEDPIIFSVVNTDLNTSVGQYNNQTDIGTKGLEASGHWQPNWGRVELGYSFYQTVDNPVPEYQVAGKDDVFLGAASHKLTVKSHYRINQKLSLNPSAIWTSPRYGYDYDSSVVAANAGDPHVSLQKFNSELTLNIFMNYQTESFTWGAGIFDTLNTKHQYIQAHDGGAAPLPGPGRMLYVKLTYSPDD